MKDLTELYLLRHAHAGDPEKWDGPDEQRPLSPRGEEEANRLAQFLARTAFRPDALITSPMVRASRTAEILAGQIDLPVAVDDRLEGNVDPASLEAILRDAGDPARPVLVGHDPDFSDLVGALCGARDVPMRKGALVRIDIRRPIEPGRGELRWLVPPDLLRPAGGG